MKPFQFPGGFTIEEFAYAAREIQRIFNLPKTKNKDDKMNTENFPRECPGCKNPKSTFRTIQIDVAEDPETQAIIGIQQVLNDGVLPAPARVRVLSYLLIKEIGGKIPS